MPQAYEYKVVSGNITSDGNIAAFMAQLAALDADGWEVIGFAISGSGFDTSAVTLLKRRV